MRYSRASGLRSFDFHSQGDSRRKCVTMKAEEATIGSKSLSSEVLRSRWDHDWTRKNPREKRLSITRPIADAEILGQSPSSS